MQYIVRDKVVKTQKELPDSVALALIVFLVIGTLSYFVSNHWQRVKSIENAAAQVNAAQVADKMEKQRQDIRAVMNGEKTLADVDAEAASAEAKNSLIQKVSRTDEQPKTAAPEQKPAAVEKESEKPAKKPEAAVEKAEAESKPVSNSGTLPTEKKTAAPTIFAGDINQYSCSQKQQCSQMKSCAEAKFYAKQCSNSQIKPNANGKVCPELCGS